MAYCCNSISIHAFYFFVLAIVYRNEYIFDFNPITYSIATIVSILYIKIIMSVNNSLELSPYFFKCNHNGIHFLIIYSIP